MKTVYESDPLAALAAAELDHVALGLLNAFSAELIGCAGAELFFLVTESRKRLALQRLTVGDAWKVAKAEAEGAK